MIITAHKSFSKSAFSTPHQWLFSDMDLEKTTDALNVIEAANNNEGV
jgi:hypothetical protein